MSICYQLLGKVGNQPWQARVKNFAEAVATLKVEIRALCNIRPELEEINRPDLPSPGYRASVCRYLQSFFESTAYPSPDLIDYSDYWGPVRCFPPNYEEEGEDFETASGYERKFQMIEHFEYSSVTPYEEALGFVFAVGVQGMHLQFLGSQNSLTTICQFHRLKDRMAFSFESGQDGRTAVDLCVEKGEGTPTPKLSGSFYGVMLLSYLLDGMKAPILPPRENGGKMGEESPEMAFVWKLSADLYDKRNGEKMYLTSVISPTVRTVERYFEAFRVLGYDIHKEKGEYYLPPFICKQDAEMIMEAIEAADLPQAQSRVLVEKFKRQFGYARYGANRLEETIPPVPRKENWNDRYYTLLIWEALRLSAHPLPVTSTKKESLKGLIREKYGIDNISRDTLTSGLCNMMAMDLPIRREKGGYVLDREATGLTVAELEQVCACVAKDTVINEAQKTRLIHKLQDRYGVGRH